MNSPELRYKGTNFITGMRAFAALAVVMIHTGGAGLRSLGAIGNKLADAGSAGSSSSRGLPSVNRLTAAVPTNPTS